MEVLYLRGDRAAAIAAWDECRETLRRAFGVAPSAATNELGKLIVASAAAPASASERLPASLLRPPQLIGRAGVLDGIERTLQLCHAVVIAGPGGIGKSRLIAEVTAAHAPSLVVAARAGDRVLPGASFARLLGSALRRFAPPLDEATQHDVALLLTGDPDAAQLASALEHRRVLDSAARALQACARQGLRLLAFDDLQFADDASIAALQVLVGHWLAAEADPREYGLLPLVGVRDAEVSPAGAALLALLADSRRSARFDLAPLAAADVCSLLAELPLRGDSDLDLDELASALHAQVGGNPAFVLESLKSLWLDRFASWRPGQPLPVPATLRESLRRRLERLAEPALQVAQLAAVAQRDFSLGLAAAALGRAPLALAPILGELEAAQIFRGHGFSHDLVAEAVLESLPAALVGPLHRLVADHLMSANGAAAAIAWHLDRAGDTAPATMWHLKAARLARDRWQLAEAAASFEAAARGLEAHGADGNETAAMAWRDAGRAWLGLARQANALAALERGLASATTARERLRLRASRTLALHNGQQRAEAIAESLALAEELEAHLDDIDPPEQAAALFAAAIAAPYVREPQRLADLCERLRGRCGVGSRQVRQAYFQASGLILAWLGLPLRAEPELAAAREIAIEFADHAVTVNASNQRMRTALMRGDFERVDADIDELMHALKAGGHGPTFAADGCGFRALLRLAQGRPVEAMAELERMQALAAAGQKPLARDWLAIIALAWMQRGRRERAQAIVEGAGTEIDQGGIAFVRIRLAQADASRLDDALDVTKDGWPPPASALGMRLRTLEAFLRRPPLADVQVLIATLRERGLRPLERLAHLAAARAAVAIGEQAAAGTHARAALAMAALVDPWVDEPAQVWLEAGAALRAAGAVDEAKAAFAAGRAWVEQAAATLESDDDRRAWREGNPVHRALLVDTLPGR
jgi:tetratricopeptide (TPR) repeat protein